MPSVSDVGSIFKTLREVDLAALVHQAEDPFLLAVVGRPGAGKDTLVQAMRLDPRSGQATLDPVLGAYSLPLSAEDEETLKRANAAVLLLDATRPDFQIEHEALQKLQTHHVPVVVAYNRADQVTDPGALLAHTDQWRPEQVVAIAAPDRARLESVLVPALLRLLKGRELAVARALPLFRPAVVRGLIEETAFANAAYSFTTGLAEVVPVLDVPLNLGDMVMLTKNQGLMAFKIALAMGLSSDWRQTLPQLAAVVGAGFMWRQIGRSLVGLVPGWGIVPKVGIAYAGTVVVGQAVQYWALTGEKLKPAALQESYQQAIEKGKEFARSLMERRQQALEQRRQLADQRREEQKAKQRAKQHAQLEKQRTKKGHCPHCGHRVPRDAAWCPYCGASLTAPALPPGGTAESAGGQEPPENPT